MLYDSTSFNKKEEEKFLVIIKVFLLILQRDRNRRVQKSPHKN